MKRQNILLIHADQHRFDCLGINGHKQIKTPNLDRLAKEGVNFNHAFTPTAICSPARASLLTGQWPHQHGCLSIPQAEIYAPANPELPTFPQLLKKEGYGMAWIGKYHDEIAEKPDEHGFDIYVPETNYPAWRKAQGIDPLPRIEENWFGCDDPDADDTQTKIAWEAGNVMDAIDRFTGEDKPFLVRWDPFEPHPPCRPPKSFSKMYPPESIEPWGSFDDPLENKPYIQKQQKHTWKIENWTWDDWAPVVARYYAEISHMDQQIGRVLNKLDADGLTENTLVLYSTDHGDLCGGHGMYDKHFIMYDEVMRVPMIGRWPGHIEGGKTCDAFVVNELDISKTILAAAGIKAPETFVGKNLADVACGTDLDPRPDIFGAWHGGQFGSYTQRMLRDRRWKYIWNTVDVDELYDLESDPHEIQNRVHDPECLTDLKRLRRRMASWMTDLGDRMLNQWTSEQLLHDRKI